MSKYLVLADWLSRNSSNAVPLRFSEIDAILGFPLPPSGRRYPAFWAGSPVVEELGRVGWRASPRLNEGMVEFRRVAMPRPTNAPERSVAALGSTRPDVVLVGCVKTKLTGRHVANELYTSSLFQGRRRHAESMGVPWFILSTQFGLVAPEAAIDSYELSMQALTSYERQAWSRRILAALEAQFGPVRGKIVEIHAGYEYRAYGLVGGLKARGALVIEMLSDRSIGEQIAWYQRDPERADNADAFPPAANVSPVKLETGGGATSLESKLAIARRISADFYNGNLDLSARIGAPTSGWNAMPECAAVAQIRSLGAFPAEIRTFITLMAAMDRARNASLLWANGVRLFEAERWVFTPANVVQRSLRELRDKLALSGVSQRHGIDAAGWRLIAEALLDQESPPSIRRAVFEGVGDARELQKALELPTPGGQSWYPFLSGPKISVMWIRMLADPGSAAISAIQTLPVAVDVQVRKVSEYLGITETMGKDLESVRTLIQDTWRELASVAVGPALLAGSSAALDPALWFFGSWGCSYCERAHRKLPISRACQSCRYLAVAPT